MRKPFITLLLLALLSLGAWAQTKQLTILHTNDTHSCVEPLSPALKDTALAGRGGFLRRVALVNQERKKDPNLLLFDSGDFSQGSAFYTIFKGDVEIDLMNKMGYDAATIGNHEFDFGLDNMARIFRRATFPIICSNYDFTGTPVEGTVKPWMVMKRNGVKIGVFALCPEMEGLVDTAKFVGVKYLDPVKVANETAAMLKKKEKCDLVICISHMGWDKLTTSDQDIVAAARNIDLVLGGHSHSYFEKLYYVSDLDGRDIPVDQNGKHGIWIGKMTLQMKKK